MLRITVHDNFPHRAINRPRRSLSLPFHRPRRAIAGFSSRKSISYSQLPEEPVKLSVVRLDGSAFDIVVARSASISELKLAVEAAFSHMPKSGPGKISWSHVWGHFCLCYEGQKLVIETDSIIHYGIKDGDQLHFIRHISITYNMEKKKKVADSKGTHKFLNRGLKEKTHKDCDSCMGDDDDFEDLEKGKRQGQEEEDHKLVAFRQCRSTPAWKQFFFFRILLRLV